MCVCVSESKDEGERARVRDKEGLAKESFVTLGSNFVKGVFVPPREN